MLLQKQTLPYIGVFKLNSGEEFIGTVVEESMVSYTISKPRCLVQTDKGLQFAPLIMMADLEGTAVVPKPVITAAPNPGLLTQYESLISGIALPAKSGIIS